VNGSFARASMTDTPDEGEQATLVTAPWPEGFPARTSR